MIEFKNVTKKYGETTAINRVSLRIPGSGIYCLLGRNGAGKTTLMKLLAGHIASSGGEITVNGEPVSTSRMPECVNFIESGSVQFNMKASDLIGTAAALQDGFDRNFATKMAKRFDLNLNKRFKQLSFGMKTMLTTIITLSNNSKVILLDEPTLGFDAIMRDQFNTLLLESYRTNPRVLIVSTHLIDEISKVTENLIIIESGNILVEAGIDDIDEKAYTLTGAASLVLPLLNGLNCIGKTVLGNVMAAHIYGNRINPPDGVTLDRMGLQDFFINMVGGKSNDN
ncbi:MAG: ABC transporter ATP-binding protein [Defluviitaleaceae bacterium]|nr:ABC transporter ATP-binding protein [Defluviitaleaceae bacterium]MCL2836968.1 ABC transporter ATP-binding protein [Defluviitaleaceae bacterium]